MKSNLKLKMVTLQTHLMAIKSFDIFLPVNLKLKLITKHLILQGVALLNQVNLISPTSVLHVTLYHVFTQEIWSFA